MINLRGDNRASYYSDIIHYLYGFSFKGCGGGGGGGGLQPIPADTAPVTGSHRAYIQKTIKHSDSHLWSIGVQLT